MGSKMQQQHEVEKTAISLFAVILKCDHNGRIKSKTFSSQDY